METDIKSLLDARAAALLRGVAKLPPIEQDLRRLRSTHAPSYHHHHHHHLVTCNPHCGLVNYMERNQQCGRSVITLHTRQPPFGVHPFPNRQQVHHHHPLPHQAFSLQWQPPQPVRPTTTISSAPPKKVCEELHLPQPSVDTKTPLGVLISSARVRTRRSSDYSAVSQRTRELTLYSLVESLLKQQQQQQHRSKSQAEFYGERRPYNDEEDESTPKQQQTSSPSSLNLPTGVTSETNLHVGADCLLQSSMECLRSRVAVSSAFGIRRSVKPSVFIVPSSSSSSTTADVLSPRDERITNDNNNEPPKEHHCTSVSASRCSTADVGLSRASFWEDEDDEEYIDEHFTYVPKPPSHRKEISNRVYNLCDESL